MPCKYEIVQSYLSGRKFKKAKEESSFTIDSYKPYIIPSVKAKYMIMYIFLIWWQLRKKLFCCLTGKYINQIQSHIDKHMSGRKYQTALKKCV